MEIGQTIISDMSKLYPEVIVGRLPREYNVKVDVDTPQITHKETFIKPMDVKFKYAKQSGGKNQYDYCRVKSESMDTNAEKTYGFVNAVTGGTIPRESIAPTDEDIQGAAKSGILDGHPILGVKVAVYDGSYHEVDSSEMALHTTGSPAFKGTV